MGDAVGLAKLETHMELLLKGQERAEQSQKELGSTVNIMDKKIDGLDYRLTTLETSFNEAKPTIAEFIATKNKVQGAGILGNWLWFIGGLILSGAAWVSGTMAYFGNGGK